MVTPHAGTPTGPGKPTLEDRAAAGDRNAIRELRLQKLAGFAHDRSFGDLRPDANGRLPKKGDADGDES